MTTKEITLCSKKVMLGYCYATEIAYKDITGDNIGDYMQEALPLIQEKKDPDIKKTICAVIACMVAYYQSRNEDSPITDADIMNDATPAELGMAILAVVGLYMDFYKIPAEVKKKKEKEQKGRGKKKN